MKKNRFLLFLVPLLFNYASSLAQGVRLSAKVFFNNVDAVALQMDDYVKTIQNFPLIDPYSSPTFSSAFSHVNNPTVATLLPSAINITGNSAIVDWVFVELRQGISGATTVVATKSGILTKSGIIIETDILSPLLFSNTPPGNYYITIRHRNHLGFRTLHPIALSNTVTTLDFTNNSVPVYGATPLLPITPTIWAMNGGDANFDGSIDAFDTISWESQNGLFDNYENNADYNLDGSVDAFDSIIWEIANGRFQELD